MNVPFERKTWLQRWAVAGVCLLAMILAPMAIAQENFGLITGTVTDATGAAVPEAKLTAESPTLPRGLETTSDGQGRFLFPQVPIGVYTLTITKQGFSRLVQRNIEVRLGREITYNAKLNVSAVAETIEVQEAAQALDVTSAKTSTNITAATFDNLPKGRNFHSLLAMAPGVRMETKNGNAGVGGFQVDGASGSENAFLIDGVDVSDIRRGSLRQQNSIPFEFISEIQIKSSGFEAEFGGATGGVVNVATKGGANDFHGRASYEWTNDSLNPTPRGYWQRSPLSADRADFYQQPKDNSGSRWPGFSLSGPIVKNLLFFSLGYYPQLDSWERTIKYTSGTRVFPREDTIHYGLGRVDFAPTSKLQVNSSWNWSPWKQTGSLQNPDPRVAAPSNNLAITGGFQPAQTVTTSGTYTINSRWIASARWGYKYQNDKLGNYGLPGDPYVTYSTSAAASPIPVPPEVNRGSGYANVSSTLGVVKDITTRQNIYLDSSYIANVGGQQHIFKFGYAIARVSNDVSTDYTNGRFQIYWGDKFSRGNIQNVTGTYGYYIWQDGVRNLGNVNSRNQGMYFQDTWRAHKNLTLNLGIRFENEFLPPYKAEVNGRKVADPVSFGWGDKVAPRIGAAWDILGDGKWKLAGSFGFFFDVLKYELARGSFGSDYWVSHVYQLNSPNVLSLGKANPGALGPKITQYDNRTLPINSAGEIEGIDPGIKPYQSREYTVTLSREISSKLVASVRYTRKDLMKAIEDIGVLDADYNEVYLIGNPGFGQTRDTKTDYGQKTPNGQEFLVPKAIRQYDGLEMRLDGRYFNRVNAMASYTWSRLYGNYSGAANSDESGRSDPGVSRAFDLPYYYFDASGSQKNVLGLLGTDRPHTLKLFGSYDLNSKLGTTTFGLTQFAWSGTPDSTSVIYIAAPTFPNGRADMGRTPFLWQTDLGVQHSYKIGERYTIRFEANIVNLLNNAATIARVTQYNRASAISDARLSPANFFKGYNLTQYVNPTNTVGGPPYNPIYGLPGGNYASGGSGAYQAPRNIRLGFRFLF